MKNILIALFLILPISGNLPNLQPEPQKVFRLQIRFSNQPNYNGYWIHATKIDGKKVWIYTPDVVVIEEIE